MARIRTIKPDFWTDGNMIGLSFEARLFYIGTWNFALCDHGHLPDDAMGLKLKILPADNVDPVAIIDELMTKRRIVRIGLPDGRTFLHIPRLDEHQKVDARWASRCPVCTHLESTGLTETPASSGETHEEIANSAGTPLGGEGRGKESKGREGTAAGGARPSMFCSSHPNGTDRPCRACGNARRIYDAWSPPQAQTQIPPRKGDLCERHEWNRRENCIDCAAERRASA